MATKKRAKPARLTKRKPTKRKPTKRVRRVKRVKAERPSHRVHEVRARLGVEELAKAGSALNLEVFRSGEKLGELEIGRGSLFWTGRLRHKSKRIRWPDFADMMNKLAYGPK